MQKWPKRGVLQPEKTILRPQVEVILAGLPPILTLWGTHLVLPSLLKYAVLLNRVAQMCRACGWKSRHTKKISFFGLKVLRAARFSWKKSKFT